MSQFQNRPEQPASFAGSFQSLLRRQLGWLWSSLGGEDAAPFARRRFGAARPVQREAIATATHERFIDDHRLGRGTEVAAMEAASGNDRDAPGTRSANVTATTSGSSRSVAQASRRAERDADAIATAIEMLLNHQHLTLQDENTVAAAVARFRRRPAIGFSDCLMVEVARKAGHGPLGTFDRDLGKLDGAHRL